MRGLWIRTPMFTAIAWTIAAQAQPAPATRPTTRPADARSVVLVTARAIERGAKQWTLHGPCIIRHEAAQFILKSDGDLKVTPVLNDLSEMTIEGDFISVSSFGSQRMIQRGERVHLEMFGNPKIRVLTTDTLEAVEQRVDDARLEVDDPRKAFVYAQQEARLGNFSPILRLLEGDKKVAQLKEDELRAEAAEATGKRPEDLAGVPRARLMQMMMISDVWIEALETIDVEVSLNRPEEVSLTVHRATGATGYRMVRIGKRWSFH